jgi:hypothetical protein
MPTFFYFYFPLLFIAMVIAIVYGFKRAKKQILADAEAKGWNNIKVRQGFWDLLVTYQDENGTPNKTRCRVFGKKPFGWMIPMTYILIKKPTKQKPKTGKSSVRSVGSAF